MASLDNLDPPAAPKTFSLFLKLPIELRAKIWAIAGNRTPRLVEVTACDVYHGNIPHIPCATRESRAENQRFYKRMFEDLPIAGVKDGYIYLNQAIDTAIFLPTPEESLRPRYLEIRSTGLDTNWRPLAMNGGKRFQYFPAPLDTFQKAMCDWRICFPGGGEVLGHATILLHTDWSTNLACAAAGLRWCTNLKDIVLDELNRLAAGGFVQMGKGVRVELAEINGERDGDELVLRRNFWRRLGR